MNETKVMPAIVKPPRRKLRGEEIIYYPDSDGKPMAEHFDPPLQGYRLVERTYQPILPLPAERGVLGIASEVLELELWMRPDGGEGMSYVLRLYDPATDAWLLTPPEEAEARRQAEARAAELEAELERLRAQLGQDDN